MIVRNRIWEELRQAKCHIICLQRYTDKTRKRSRTINALTVLFASIGAIGGIYDPLFAIIASALIAISSILKSLIPHIIQSDQELAELDRLMDYYSRYLNAIEKVWYENENKVYDEKYILERFFTLKDEEADKYSAMNKGVRDIPTKEMKKINDQAREYVNRVYFNYAKSTDENNQKRSK